MEMIFCPNCNKLTGYKRALGFGTFFAVVLTAGLWLLTIPFYPKRCITCGLRKSDSIPWYRTWRLGFVLAVGVLALGSAMYSFFPSRAPQNAALELLGFQERTKDAGLHASALAFRLTGCEDRGEESKACNYVREPDEKLSLVFWGDQLQRVEYDFGIRRYGPLLKELSAKYGPPSPLYEQYNPTSKISDNWGSLSEGTMLSLIERADHTGGVATLDLNQKSSLSTCKARIGL